MQCDQAIPSCTAPCSAGRDEAGRLGMHAVSCSAPSCMQSHAVLPVISHLYERRDRSVKPQPEELLLSSAPSSSSSPSGFPLPPPRGVCGG